MNLLTFKHLIAVVALLGLIRVAYHYRRQPLPIIVAILRHIALLYLRIVKRFIVANPCPIPPTGPVIFVANHTTSYDPVLLQAATGSRLIQFMQAREFYEQKYLNFFFKWLKVIPVNRNGNDTASIRTALRALSDGCCLGMFPEGRISDDGRLQEGRQGVALLALMSNATVVPAYIKGTSPFAGMVKDFALFDHVTLYFGQPLRFDDLAGRARDEAARQLATERIMNEIIALRDRYETNPERLAPA